MNKEEEILSKILGKIGYEKREELEDKINHLMSENPRLTRLGALYLIGEELEIFGQVDSTEYIVPIAKLVGGLNNVNVRGRVIGKRIPSVTSGTEYAYLRLGDNTGVVSAIAWSDALRKIKEMSIAVGDVIFVKEAYTKEGINGKIELHLGRNAVIKKMEDTEVQPLDAFFREELPSGRHEVELDVKAKIIGLSDEFSIYYQEEKIPLREALLMIGERLTTITAWREQIELFKNASPGQVVLIAAAKYVNSKLVITSKTCITFLNNKIEESKPQLEIDVLDELGQTREDYTHVAACSNYLLFIKHSEIQAGKSYIVKGYELFYKNKKWILIPHELVNRQERSASNIQFTYPLSNVSEELPYVCVDGRIESKTPLAARRLKNGEEMEILNFWLTDGEKNIYCRAYGENAVIINDIPDGSWIRLKWVRVRRTKFGNLELIIDELSRVETIREDSYQ